MSKPAAKPVTYYVMRELEGGECCEYHCQTFDEANAKVQERTSGRNAVPAREYSIWRSTGEIVATFL